LNSYPPPGPGPYPGGVSRRIEEAIELIEMEVRHAAAYVNAAIVPQVRAESISALRNVANSLRGFADKLDQKQAQAHSQNPAPSQAPPQAQPPDPRS
jgi:hypothetical protein